MARATKAGWYPTDDGGRRYWNGNAWTARYEPRSPGAGAPRGWYRDSPTTYRWWTGEAWNRARIADDGACDLANDVGQGVVRISGAMVTLWTVMEMIPSALKEYPPSEGRLNERARESDRHDWLCHHARCGMGRVPGHATAVGPLPVVASESPGCRFARRQRVCDASERLRKRWERDPAADASAVYKCVLTEGDVRFRELAIPDG